VEGFFLQLDKHFSSFCCIKKSALHKGFPSRKKQDKPAAIADQQASQKWASGGLQAL
jgi:hypothetical protein